MARRNRQLLLGSFPPAEEELAAEEVLVLMDRHLARCAHMPDGLTGDAANELDVRVTVQRDDCSGREDANDAFDCDPAVSQRRARDLEDSISAGGVFGASPFRDPEDPVLDRALQGIADDGISRLSVDRFVPGPFSTRVGHLDQEPLALGGLACQVIEPVRGEQFGVEIVCEYAGSVNGQFRRRAQVGLGVRVGGGVAHGSSF